MSERAGIVLPGMGGYARLYGWTLAHARSGDWVDIAACLGAGRSIAEADADQYEWDYDVLTQAAKGRRIAEYRL